MKYIERPMTIGRRKWDMRQWVLVASWNPLVVFMCRECYARFAVEEYDESPETQLQQEINEEQEEDEDEDEDDEDDDDDDEEKEGEDGDKEVEQDALAESPEDNEEDSESDQDDDDEDEGNRAKLKAKAKRITNNGGFVHLVNNSVSKYSDNFNRVFRAENGAEVRGHMVRVTCRFLEFASGRNNKTLLADGQQRSGGFSALAQRHPRRQTA